MNLCQELVSDKLQRKISLQSSHLVIRNYSYQFLLIDTILSELKKRFEGNQKLFLKFAYNFICYGCPIKKQ